MAGALSVEALVDSAVLKTTQAALHDVLVALGIGELDDMVGMATAIKAKADRVDAAEKDRDDLADDLTKASDAAARNDEYILSIQGALDVADGADLVEAIDELKKERPILSGYDLAGEEESYTVAALVAVHPDGTQEIVAIDRNPMADVPDEEVLPLYGALLLMRQFAVEVGTDHGLGSYVRCAPEIRAPGGDLWSVRIVEDEDEDDILTRFIEITLEPSAYQIENAENRILLLRNDLSETVRNAKAAKEQLKISVGDPVIREECEKKIRQTEDFKASVEKQIAELETKIAAKDRRTWRFPATMAGVSLFATGAA